MIGCSIVYCNRLHALWSAQLWLGALLSIWLHTGGLGIGLYSSSDLGPCLLIGWWGPGLSGPPGFTHWVSFALVFGFVFCWVFALSPFCILIYMFWEVMRWWVGGLSCKQSVCVSWSATGLNVGLAPWNQFGPSGKNISLTVTMRLMGGGCWPLGADLWCMTVGSSLSRWCPGYGVVLDCFDSWPWHPYLLLYMHKWCLYGPSTHSIEFDEAIWYFDTLWCFRLNDLSIDEMVGAWCFGCLLGLPGFTCWTYFALVFSFIYCWVLIFVLFPLYLDLNVFEDDALIS